jgi:thioester reductase-like protein
MKNGPVLITGATGIMGSWVLGEALMRGYTPIALMRDPTEDAARERLRAVLSLIGLQDRADDIRILCGDTRKPDLGLRSAEVAEMRANLGGMIHCAACTSFSPREDAELWATNVGGVANVLHFLAGSGVPLFHVSTAFVAGKRRGRALESELDLNQDFNNTYERSKCEAERMVQDAVAKGSIRACIFRPAIIVGSTSGGAISQFMNFYGFLRFIDAASTGRLGTGRLRVRGNPLATKNLVPVDWVSKALWTIIETDGASGNTYHLTNPTPSTQQRLLEWANQWMSVSKVSLEYVSRLEGDVSPLEQAANVSFRLYRSYLQYEPVFDRTNTDRALNGSLEFPKLGQDFYQQLLDFARAERWRGVFGCATKSARTPKATKQAPDSDLEDALAV